jgi:hypothetical protein
MFSCKFSRKLPSAAHEGWPFDEGGGHFAEQVDFNYMSLTQWADKASFNAWRTGEAFKEAHGGGTLFGFVEMLVSFTLLVIIP